MLGIKRIIVEEIKKVIINEGRLDDLSTKLTRHVMPMIRNGFKEIKVIGKVKGNDILWVDPVSNLDLFKTKQPGNSKFNLYAAIFFIEKGYNLDVQGQTGKIVYGGRPAGVMQFQVYLPGNNSEELLLLLAQLKSAIRHELEHLFMQLAPNPDSQKEYDDPNNLLSYMFSKHEIPAWSAGILKHAKTIKQPFHIVARETLGNIYRQYSHKFDEQFMNLMLDSIWREWAIYTKRRYPELKLPDPLTHWRDL